MKPSLFNDKEEEDSIEQKKEKKQKTEKKDDIPNLDAPAKKTDNKEVTKKEKKIIKNKYFQELNREIEDRPEERVL